MQASSLPRRLLGLSRKARRRARHGLLLSCHTDLEARALLSAVPAWIEQGPAPINGSERIDVPFGITTGAIQSVAINPGNPAQIYVATVNGGVWRTDNANGQNPAATRWTPLTDQLPSLAMGDLAFSPLDASHKTLFAGTGSFSSGGPATDNAGGPPIGVLRTTDGGANWTVHPLNPGGAEFRVKALLPTSIRVRTPGGDQPMVLAGTVLGGGLYRSDDNGETYSLLSGHDGLPRGDVTSLIVDPNDPNRFYAGIAATSSSRGGLFRGVFDSVTQLITWTEASPSFEDIAANVQVAAGNQVGSTVLYSLLSGPKSAGGAGKWVDAYRSDDGGATWTRLAKPPELFEAYLTNRSGNVILVDPTDSRILYAATYGESKRDDPGGEEEKRQEEDVDAKFDVFSFNFATSSWAPLAFVPNPSNPAVTNGGPHVDSRDLAFQQETDTLFLTCDGGIYGLQNPRTPGSGQWQAYSGNDGTAVGSLENHNAAWDPVSDSIIVGAQDNGVSYRPEPRDLAWTALLGADGGEVVVDPVSLAAGQQSIRYASTQRLGGLSRFVFNSDGSLASSFGLGIPGNQVFNPLFITPIAVNSGAAARRASLVIGGGAQDNGPGAVFQSDNAASATATAPAVWKRVPIARPSSVQGDVSSLAFGGRSGRTKRPGILYVGYDSGDLLLRLHKGGVLRKTAPLPVRDGIVDIATAPDDWRRVFVVTATRVFESRNAGRTWIDRTGSLNNPNLHTVIMIKSGGSEALLVGGLGGVFRSGGANQGVWTRFGANLPNTVTYDLDYDATDDVLLAAAFGRGTWLMRNASAAVRDASQAGSS